MSRHLILLSTVLLLIGCQSRTERMLIGRWTQNMPDTPDLIFRTHHLLELPDSGVGAWRAQGDQLFLTFPPRSDGKRHPEFADKILKLTRDEFRVHTVGDTILVYHRVE